MKDVVMLLIGAAIGLVVDQGVTRWLRRHRAREGLRIRSATFARFGGRTTCTVVVENKSDGALTLTAGMELRPPAGGSSDTYELRGAAAAKFKDANGIDLGADDEKVFTWTVVREGTDGQFDLSGWSIAVHAGSRQAVATLEPGN